MKKKNNVFVSVGEYSGDLLASELVGCLHDISSDLSFFGITGAELRRAHVETILTADELSVMGFSGVVSNLGRLRELETRILAAIDRKKPAFAILVDNPGFHFQLAEKLKIREIPTFQYVAPKLWAWGEGRVNRLKKDFKHTYGILPFEGDFFKNHGIDYTYFGCPIRDRVEKTSAHKSDFNLAEDAKVVVFLPGSRLQEIQLIFPRMQEIRESLMTLNPQIQCVIPIAENLDFEAAKKILKKPGFLTFKGCSLELLHIADAAVVASGTATLETALSNVPMTVVYVMNDLNYQIASKVVKIKYISLVNLIAQKEIVKEHVQHFSSRSLAIEINELVCDTPRRHTMIDDFNAIKSTLYTGSSARVARSMLEKVMLK